MLQKPHPLPEKRLPKKKAMTIALGLLCEGGAIIAADTQVVEGETWTTTHAPKVIHFPVNGGYVAIALSSSDANEAIVMVRTIQEALQRRSFDKWNQIEHEIAAVMTDFFVAYNSNPPQHSLVAVAFLKNLGMGLYLCNPPKTVLPKLLEGYVAVGLGADVTDPLRSILFEFSRTLPPQLALRQVAYLMYRAKKEKAAGCGGDTTAYYVCEDGREPEMVRLADFVAAEKEMSQLDCVLGMAANVALSDEDSAKKSSGNVALTISSSTRLRDVVFHNLELEPIRAPIE